MKVARLYIPLSVRVIVAERQLVERGLWEEWQRLALTIFEPPPLSVRLRHALRILFGAQKVELHHRPALVNRRWSKRKKDYDPPANSPKHLVYLLKDEEHRIETYVRGQRGQLSDAGLRRKNKRMAKNRRKGLKVAGHLAVMPMEKQRAAVTALVGYLDLIKRPIRNANRWPAKGTRKLRSRR